MHRAFAVVLLVLLAACSSSSSTGSNASTSGPSTSAPTTTAATTTTTPLVAQPTPDDAAAAFMQAWRNNDQATAATLAVADAVASAFAAGIPSSVQDRGCMEGGFDPTSCVFRTDLGEVQVRTTKVGDGWIVDQVQVTES